MPALDRVVAARHQRLVGGGGGARAIAIELLPPEVSEVRLVPDVDRSDLREAIEQRGDEAAVLRGYVNRRCPWAPVHAQDQLLRAGVPDRLTERDRVRVGRLCLTWLPALGDPVVAEAEVIRDRGDPRPPLDGVVVDADRKLRSGERGACCRASQDKCRKAIRPNRTSLPNCMSPPLTRSRPA